MTLFFLCCGQTLKQRRHVFFYEEMMMKMMMVMKSAASLLLMTLLHLSPGHRPSDVSASSSISPQCVLSLLLLGLAVVLSTVVYVRVLGHVCEDCCRPVTVGSVQPEAVDVTV